LFAYQFEVCCGASTSRDKLECDFCLGYQYYSVRRLAKYTSHGNGIIKTTHILQHVLDYEYLPNKPFAETKWQLFTWLLLSRRTRGVKYWALPSKCCGFFIRRQCNAMFRYFRNFKSELGMVWTDTATKESILFPY